MRSQSFSYYNHIPIYFEYECLIAHSRRFPCKFSADTRHTFKLSVIRINNIDYVTMRIYIDVHRYDFKQPDLHSLQHLERLAIRII